ncbi:PilW family protein [Luteimonas sp. A501]
MYLSLRRSQGVTLIELLVALLIGSLLILGLVQVFSASRAAYQMSEGMARVQENSRFAMDFLQRDIRMAGHYGCVNDQAHLVRGEGDPVSHLGTFTSGAGNPLDFSVSIQGYEAAETAPGDSVTIGGAPAAGWSPTLPGAIQDLEPLPGSDVIVLRYLGSRGTPVMAIETTQLTIPGAPVAVEDPPPGWPVLTDEGVANPTLFGMADCSHADVFAGAGDGGNVKVDASLTPALAAKYNAHPAGQTLLYRANSIVYYVAEGASNEPALHRARYNGGAYAVEELVEGIESLQLLYGLDETIDISPTNPPVGNITQHQTADVLAADASEWQRVGLVQIGMLASSPDRATSPQATSGVATDVRVLGLRFLPAVDNDGRYRTSYEATIALRNRLFGN